MWVGCSPDVRFRVRQHYPKQVTPVGKHVKQAVPHLWREEAKPVLSLRERVDDVRDEGGKVEA